MIKIQDPIRIAITVLITSFLLHVILLFLIKPGWVRITDKKSGESTASIKLIIVYSATFSLVSATAALLISAQRCETYSPINTLWPLKSYTPR